MPYFISVLCIERVSKNVYEKHQFSLNNRFIWNFYILWCISLPWKLTRICFHNCRRHWKERNVHISVSNFIQSWISFRLSRRLLQKEQWINYRQSTSFNWYISANLKCWPSWMVILYSRFAIWNEICLLYIFVEHSNYDIIKEWILFCWFILTNNSSLWS